MFSPVVVLVRHSLPHTCNRFTITRHAVSVGDRCGDPRLSREHQPHHALIYVPSMIKLTLFSVSVGLHSLTLCFTISQTHTPPRLDSIQQTRQPISSANPSSEVDPERQRRALEDPEIQAILRDPTMSRVLQELQTDPKSGAAALKDPKIRAYTEKLAAAGRHQNIKIGYKTAAFLKLGHHCHLDPTEKACDITLVPQKSSNHVL
jgi:hypothetical protein